MDPIQANDAGVVRGGVSLPVACQLPRKLKQGTCLVGRRTTGHGESDRDPSFRQAQAALELAGWSVRFLHAQLEIAGFEMDAAGSAIAPKAFIDLERRYVALFNGCRALLEGAGENIPVLWRQFVAVCKDFSDAELHAYPKLLSEEACDGSRRIPRAQEFAAAVGCACSAMVAQPLGET